ncbi:threonine aldolase [Nocardiopsis sp. CNR-923]|uniref:threonine aldolase family protein n=1 Tax=Nocardiopsis sp. CNR-923 TaxID=1904965 RepID=UPI000958F05B|nr:GntG family PLP-dependent aldolase [Nocardiopsis sp. CNR-923]OLT28140.1 threonine aldolase [Nocardiopsis sp. CNR-923]
MIDLRSDTVTRPTAAMRRAIAAAEVGDDVFGEDPTVRALEEETAVVLGKEAAVYVPSGHMANQVALYVSTRSGEEVWAHEHHHVIGDEQGATAVLSRALPRLYSGAPVPDDDLLTAWTRGARQDDAHRAEPALLWLENTFTGQVVPLAEQRRVVAFAHGNGMRAHLDGARLWNAAAALEASPAEVAAGFDTVSVCFSKGLGAPVGSAVAGDAATVRRARRARTLLGAGMRQVGIIAAGALHALRHHRERLPEDHSRAELLAERVGEAPGLSARARTNMVLVRTPDGAADRFVQLMSEHGVAAFAIGPSRIRLVLHLDITDSDVDAAAEGIAKAAAEL